MSKTDKKKKQNVFLRIIKLFSMFLGFLLILIPVVLCIILYIFNPVHVNDNILLLNEVDGISYSDDGSFYIEVRRGESAQSVGLRLERAGLIKNRYIWNILCRLEKEHIKTGTYRIELPSRQISILKTLVSGRQELYRVLIPEGVTLKKMARILEEAGICYIDDFLAAAHDKEIINHYNIHSSALSMEGYLFPDTYLFPKNYPANMTVRKMADNFFERLESISPSLRELNPRELNRIVIIASIVEREYRLIEEASLMSGVFHNRLRINMALQSCATVEYIITEIQGKPHPSVLFYQDLEIRNPYNTYIYPGLPPGPISAPGYVALRAAVYPENTSFLYFRLTDPASGKHYFSSTFDEHIRAGQLITKPSW